ETKDDGDDDEEEAEADGEGEEAYERVFPSHERIQLSVLLSNPLGVEVDVQQVTVWAIGRSNERDNAADDDGSAAAVETYPSAVLLAPYERRKRVVLSLAPLLSHGVVEVRGCFLKALNVKMSCRLPTPLVLRVVEPLPRLSLSLHEIGSLHDALRRPTAACACLRPSASAACCSYGTRRVTLDASTQLELPLLPGDHADVAFEVALSRAPPAEYEHDEQLEWTVVYGAAPSSSSSPSSEAPVLLREARHALTLVSLPSLAIVSAQVLPSYCEGVAAAGARVADNTHCLLVLDVANPTETLFLVGWRPDAADIEIGRQSTRRLVLELPRLATADEPASAVTADALAARLQALVGALHWRTYFGTTGHLSLDAEAAQQLWPAPLLFTLHAAAGLLERALETTELAADESAFPFRFFTPAHPRGRPHVFQASLLQTLRGRRAGADAAATGGDGEHARAGAGACATAPYCGVLERTVDWRSGERVEEWTLQCIFLSQGRFQVVARGCVGATTVWSHLPLVIDVV
ncbi:hypothetical protein PINS_up019190, partial [Pythium insidiosum]